MESFLCISVRFLQPLCHGRGEGGEPEWPPSPLRLFQSLVAASAGLWNERTRLVHAVPALEWLESQAPPTIIAAAGEPASVKYRLYVPDNIGDKVAASWSRGNAASIADYRTEKDVLPTRLHGEAVHFLWPLHNRKREFESHRDVICKATRSISHLGWGLDMVVANASVLSAAEAEKLGDGRSEHWLPQASHTANGLRVPVTGTLNALINKHADFLGRLQSGSFTPVSRIGAFKVIAYHRATDLPQLDIAAFQLLRVDGSVMQTYSSTTRTPTIAGMLRHITAHAAETAGWNKDKIASFVLGHGENVGESHTPVKQQRFAYLPIPSLEARGPGKPLVVGSIRRVVVTCLAGAAEEVAWARRALGGAELVPTDHVRPAILSQIPHTSDPMIRRYTKSAATWTTVTPVVLPGFDDRSTRKTESLIRKAMRQAGFPRALAENAELEWRKAGFIPGVDLASRYSTPIHLRNFSKYHVRITWKDSADKPVRVPGPICIGGGRFCGLGLFAAENT